MEYKNIFDEDIKSLDSFSNNNIMDESEKTLLTFESKCNIISSALDSIYNSNRIENDLNTIKKEFNMVKSIDKNDLEKVKKGIEILDLINDKITKLIVKSQTYKLEEENSYKVNKEKYLDYSESLIEKYGNLWMSKITDEEKDKYIDLYCKFYEKNPVVVRKNLDESIKNQLSSEIYIKESLNEKEDSINSLKRFKDELITNYGEYWFGLMTKEEKQKFIDLYSKSYSFTREDVQDLLDNLARKTFNELNNKKEKRVSKSVINKKSKELVNVLKETYNSLDSSDQEKIEKFYDIYYELSEIVKMNPENEEELREKSNRLLDIEERINSLTSKIK